MSEDKYVKTRALSLALGGVTVLRKGASDIISSGEHVYELHEQGSLRRCGGQGDILAGSLATAFYWADRMLEREASHDMIVRDSDNFKTITLNPAVTSYMTPNIIENVETLTDGRRSRTAAVMASLLAASVVKKASELGFAAKGRSMTSPDVMQQLGKAFQIISEM